ncbi:MAG TPA: hypothetical protein VFU35_03915 [Jatrophihabitans sp.]|nr:hypothetical protein [Jatrophihabitans sp.]
MLVDEPTNHVNPRAILTTDVDGGRLGWVPDMLLDYVHAVRDVAEPHVRVAHVNDSSAPPHLRILAELTGVVPTGYHPFSGPKWEPIASS